MDLCGFSIFLGGCKRPNFSTMCYCDRKGKNYSRNTRNIMRGKSHVPYRCRFLASLSTTFQGEMLGDAIGYLGEIMRHIDERQSVALDEVVNEGANCAFARFIKSV